MHALASIDALGATDGIFERQEQGLIILSSNRARPLRRVLYVNSYGGAAFWELV